MQKKLYIGGLPWEIDRVGLLNYVKAIMECNDISASYEPAFVSNGATNPNSTVKVVDVFVATDKATGKSRGFGFVTLDIADENVEEIFPKVIDLLNKRVMIGIRGPRDLIVNEADPRTQEGNGGNSNRQSAPAENGEGGAFNLDW